MRCLTRVFAAAFLLAMSVSPALAAYPERPINFIVPFGAGGSSDLIVRAVSPILEKYLGQPIVVQNKAGGGGGIGTSAIAHAKPDGYTIGMTQAGPVVIQTHYGGLDYTIDDFEYITVIAASPIILVANTKVPFKTTAEMIDWAKANPGQLRLALAAIGGLPHMMVEALAKANGFTVKTMPQPGNAQVLTTCMGGFSQLAVAHPSDLQAYIKSGEVVALGVGEAERLPDLPDIPTFKEQGFDIVMNVWKGVGAPKGTPPEVLEFLRDAFDKASQDPAWAEALNRIGEPPHYMNAEDFKATVERDDAIYLDLITALGMYNKNVTK